MSTHIYIPTLGRIGHNKQVTLREFQQYSSHLPILVCPPSEVKLHKQYYKRVMSCPVRGIGPTRQWVLDNSSADIIILADDDMYFSYRPDPADIKLERCTDLDSMIALIERCVADGFLYGGLSARQGNNHVDGSKPRQGVIDRGHMFTDCQRAMNFHYLHREKVLATGAKFADSYDYPQKVMEDFYITLQLLTKGYPNRVIYSYCWNQQGSGASGGCSTYRNSELQKSWCEFLASKFPAFVKVITKESKSTSQAWKELKVRTDVQIQWWKAYQSAKVKHAPKAKAKS